MATSWCDVTDELVKEGTAPLSFVDIKSHDKYDRKHRSFFEPSKSHKHRKRRTGGNDMRWKRSGAMLSHHGCDEHYKNRSCPACENETNVHGCGDVRFSEDLRLRKNYIVRKTDGNKLMWCDKDLGTIYFETTLITPVYDSNLYNYYDPWDDYDVWDDSWDN